MFKRIWAFFAGIRVSEEAIQGASRCKLDDVPREGVHSGEPVLLPALVDRSRVDNALAEAAPGIQSFLGRFEKALVAREVELVPGIANGERTLSGTFEGHSVVVTTICASPRITFGIDLRVVIDDIPIHRIIASSFTEKMSKSMAATLSDANALADAEQLRALGAILQQSPASRTLMNS